MIIKLLRNTLWTFPFLCFIGGYLLLDTFYNKEIETPSLVGMSVGQAFTILSHKNLNARLLAYKEDSTLQEGTIISQIPAAVQKIKENQSVFLVVSSLPQKIKAPDLILKSPEIIKHMTKNDKLNLKFFRVHTNYPENQCFAQNPSPGQQLEGDTMIAYISAGMPKVVLIPNFKNKPVLPILELLQKQGITIDLIHTNAIDEHHACRNCIITDQRPLAGSIITLNSTPPIHLQLQLEAQ